MVLLKLETPVFTLRLDLDVRLVEMLGGRWAPTFKVELLRLGCLRVILLKETG